MASLLGEPISEVIERVLDLVDAPEHQPVGLGDRALAAGARDARDSELHLPVPVGDQLDRELQAFRRTRSRPRPRPDSR